MSIDAMKQWREALRKARRKILTTEECHAAITSIDQAIAEAEKQEPVACGHCNGSGRMVRDPDIGTDQECFVCDGSGFYADTHPQPKREWVGLTGQQKNLIAKISVDVFDAMHRTGTKLKELNT